MKKVGLYFGTFNPIHVGHLIIANHFVETTDLKEVWLVVTPQNPLKNKEGLLDDHHRLAMVREAIHDNPKLRVSNIEFDLPKPSYTVYTLQILKEKYPDHEFALIMGEDNLRNFHRWKNYEYILENHFVHVYPRVHTEAELSTMREESNKFETHPHVRFNTNAPVMRVSSSYIREAIKAGRDVRYLLTEPVYAYLNSMNFYK
jgi:nicotinate-nucleotide adenylyltransferase